MEALVGGGRLLFSERIHVYACFRLVSSTSPSLCWSSVGGCFAASLRKRILCRCAALADALRPSLLVEIHFWRMLCRRCRLVRWMLCHLVCVVDLHILGGVVSFSRFSYVVLARFLEFGSVSSSVVIAWSSTTFLVVFCVRLNSLCLLRFVMVVLLSS